MEFLLVDAPDLTDKKAAYKFPNIAAEILGTPSDKVFEYFSLESKSGELTNLEQLFSHFVASNESDDAQEVNFTRAGYIQKVLNNLINNRPLIFAFYILKHPLLLKSLLRHAYCKSISLFLLNLMTLAPGTPPTANTSTGSTSVSPEGETKAEGLSLPATVADLLKETLENRLIIFGEIIEQCIATSEKDEHSDLNGNFANVVMSILNKDFSERLEFLKVFVEHMDAIIDKFVETFYLPTNNKLGNIFLVFLEILYRETDKESMSAVFDVKKLENYAARYYKLLLTLNKNNENEKDVEMRTSSFPFELPKANLKIYKVFEAILMTLKFYIGKEEFDQSIFQASGLEAAIFHFLNEYCFNSILHNQIKKYLLIVIENGTPELQDAYFAKNEHFFKFLEILAKDKCSVSYGKKRIRKGFVGQLVAITTALLKNEELAERLSHSLLIRRGLEALRRRPLQGRVRAREPGFGRHRHARRRQRKRRTHFLFLFKRC